jgi:hypothetical protein
VVALTLALPPTRPHYRYIIKPLALTLALPPHLLPLPLPLALVLPLPLPLALMPEAWGEAECPIPAEAAPSATTQNVNSCPDSRG